MDKTQATKRISIKPWHLEGDKIVDASGYYITQGSLHGKSEKSRDNDMAYIVHCVNTHDELVEALKESLSQFKFYDEHLTIKNHDKDLMNKIEQALEKAEAI